MRLMDYINTHLPKFQPILDKLQNFMHIPIACAFEAGILVWMHFTHRDLPPNVTTTVQWFYALLGGHFVGSQVWPDKTAPATQVNVDVNNDNANTNSATANAAPVATTPDPSKG